MCSFFLFRVFALIVYFLLHAPRLLKEKIMQPDITAPGVDVLAPYSPDGFVTHAPKDERSIKYNILSGTSMSCPQVAGIAGYIKTFHPDWSPSAIQSALMTTGSLHHYI